jgi:hypothetical protein
VCKIVEGSEGTWVPHESNRKQEWNYTRFLEVVLARISLLCQAAPWPPPDLQSSHSASLHWFTLLVDRLSGYSVDSALDIFLDCDRLAGPHFPQTVLPPPRSSPFVCNWFNSSSKYSTRPVLYASGSKGIHTCTTQRIYRDWDPSPAVLHFISALSCGENTADLNPRVKFGNEWGTVVPFSFVSFLVEKRLVSSSTDVFFEEAAYENAQRHRQLSCHCIWRIC